LNTIIQASDIDLERLSALMANAGFNSEIDAEDEQLVLHGVGTRLRVQLHKKYNTIRLRGHIWLNDQLKENDVQKLLTRLNDNVYLPKFTHYRWPDGEVLLLADHVIHYAMGLHVEGLLYAVRKLQESQTGVYYEHIRNTRFDYKNPVITNCLDTHSDSEDEATVEQATVQ
jgi:hypothetical protein